MRKKEREEYEGNHIGLEHNKVKEVSRRKYLQEYYQKNKEKARSYQRLYNLNHRKKFDINRINFIQTREPIQMTYTVRDIALAPTEKSLKMFNLILNQKRFFSFHIPKPAG